MKGLLKGAGIAVLALALAAGSARAQVKFGVGGGVSIPTGDALTDFKTGFHGTALLRFKPPAFPIALQFDGTFTRLSFDEGSGPSVDLNYQVISGTANAVWVFPSAPATPVKPYLIGGIGLYNQDFKGDDVPPGVESQTDFGINLGAGFDFGVSGASLFAEARFHKIFGDGSDDPTLIPITVGIRF